MVRGPAALLVASATALAWFLIAPALPTIADPDIAVLVAGGIGVALLGLVALSLLEIRDELALLALLGAAGALLTGALVVADAPFAANVPRALFAAAFGMALARLFAQPLALIAIPLFVAAIDIWSVAQGPTKLLLQAQPPALDFLAFSIPALGGGEIGQLGASDILFLALFAAFAWRYSLRRAVTATALVAAPVAAIVVELLADRPIPVLPFLAAALLLPNLDRVVALLRAQPQ